MRQPLNSEWCGTGFQPVIHRQDAHATITVSFVVFCCTKTSDDAGYTTAPCSIFDYDNGHWHDTAFLVD